MLTGQRKAIIGFERIFRGVEDGHAADPCNLGLGVHDRAGRAVFHGFAREDRANLLGQLRDLILVRLDRLDKRDVEFGRQFEPLIVAKPRFEGEVALGREILTHTMKLHHRGQCRRDVRNVRYDRAGP